MFSITVKFKWSVCAAFAFRRNAICSRFYWLQDKQVACKRRERVCEQASPRRSTSSCLQLNPSHRQGPLPRPIPLMWLVVSGWTGLRSEVVWVPGWWLSGETSQEPACFAFSSSDGGTAVFRQDTQCWRQLQSTDRWRETLMCQFGDQRSNQSFNLKSFNSNTTYIPNIINRQEQI